MKFASILWVLPFLAEPIMAVKGSVRRDLKQTPSPTPAPTPSPTNPPTGSPTEWSAPENDDELGGPNLTSNPLFEKMVYNSLKNFDATQLPPQYQESYTKQASSIMTSIEADLGGDTQIQAQQVQQQKGQWWKEPAQQQTANQGAETPPAQVDGEGDVTYKHSGSTSRSSSFDEEADGVCETFCDEYLVTCKAHSDFYDFDEPFWIDPITELPDAGTGIVPNDPLFNRRKLVRAFEPDLQRYRTNGIESTKDACLAACALYPRPLDPAQYDGAVPRGDGVNVLTDTFWCRQKHLQLAKRDPIAAAEHCPAAGPSGSYVCVNYQLTFTETIVDKYGYYYYESTRATVWERRRAGTETARRLGYCDMFYDDTIADCTKAGLDDITLPLALQLLPQATEMIILNNNPGITTLGPFVFFNNIIRARQITAIIMDDGNLQTIDPAAFYGLDRLQIISLNMQNIQALPVGMLDLAFNLKEFSLKNTRNRPGMIMEFPANFLNAAIGLQRFVLSGQPYLTTLGNTAGSGFLPNVKSIDISDNGFVDSGLPVTVWNGLNLVESIDVSGNSLTVIPQDWFSTQKCLECGIFLDNVFPLRKLNFSDNSITSIGFMTFYFLYRLNYVFLHDNPVNTIDPFLFLTNISLITYTIRPH